MYEKASALIYATPRSQWAPIYTLILGSAQRESGFICVVSPPLPVEFDFEWVLANPQGAFEYVSPPEGSFINLRAKDGLESFARATLYCSVRDPYGFEVRSQIVEILYVPDGTIQEDPNAV